MDTRDDPQVDPDRVAGVLDQIGRQIAGARAGLRLTQVEVAHLARTSPVRVSAIETGREKVRIDTLERIANAVGLTVKLEPAA